MLSHFSCWAVLGVVVIAAGCSHPSAQTGKPVSTPVLCAEYPSERQDVVSCRYGSQAQVNEVWARSTELAATSALSLGATHIQWLSAETSIDTVRRNDPVECHAHWGGVTCDGGATDVPVGLIAVTRFALLTAAEAAARSADPLVPVDRRPIDAHTLAAAHAH